MDKNLEKAINELAIARLWNGLFDCDEGSESNPDFADLDNYVSRMNHVVLGKLQKPSDSPLVDLLVNECNRIIKKNSQIDSYKNKEKEALLQLTSKKKSLKSNTSIVLLDSPERKVKKQQSTTTLIKIDDEISAPKPDLKNEEQSDQSLDDVLNRFLTRFKIEIDRKNNGDTIKEFLTDLLSKDVEIIDQVCLNLIDIQNFNDQVRSKDQIKQVSLKEESLSSLLLNLNPSQVSYNSAQAYLRSLVGEYFAIKYRSLRETSEELFSRDIMSAFNYILKEFTHQFISSCLIVWTLELASNPQQSKTLADYILKIVKEDFHEIEANLMLTGLSTQQQQSSTSCWPESIYSIVTSLVEKSACLNYEVLSSLLTRMKSDSTVLTKSSVFSKCLLLLINKCKSGGSSQTVVLNDSLLNLIEIIIGNNQTLIKKSLQTAFKSLKS